MDGRTVRDEGFGIVFWLEREICLHRWGEWMLAENKHVWDFGVHDGLDNRYLMFRWENDGLEDFFLAYKECAWGVLRCLGVKDVFASSVPGHMASCWW